MKNIIKKALISLAIIIGGSFIAVPTLAPAPVYAEENGGCAEGCVPTAILGEGHCVCDNNGDSITNILKLVVRIMTVGVGILAAIGITIVGIQYLTAGGNEEQTRKAKRRLFEIVIGLVAYVLIYAILEWLLPSFQPI